MYKRQTNASAQNSDPLAHLRVREMPITAPYVGPADPAARAADARQKAWEITNLGRDLISGEPALPVFDRQDDDESDLAWTVKFKSQCKNASSVFSPYQQICISAAGALVFPSLSSGVKPVEIISVGDNPISYSQQNFGADYYFFFTPQVNSQGRIFSWQGSLTIVDDQANDLSGRTTEVYSFN